MLAPLIQPMPEAVLPHPLEAMLENVTRPAGTTADVPNAGVQSRSRPVGIVRRTMEDVRIVEHRFSG
jgi:hypothetical protein